MPYIQQLAPLYRDADEDGRIGLRGYLRYSQDVIASWLISHGKGNDIISETYNAGWIIIRSCIHMNKKADYSAPICASLWLEPYAQPVIANVLIRYKQNGSILAEARFELCVMNLPRRRVVRFSFIEFPEGLAETVPSGFPVFADKHVPDEALINQYYRTVRYSDLDINRHMNNLRYMEMFEDAYDSSFWWQFHPNRIEIRYQSQCMEGEQLSIKSCINQDGAHIAAFHIDGQPAAEAIFSYEQ